jgi:hypothetical protein
MNHISYAVDRRGFLGRTGLGLGLAALGMMQSPRRGLGNAAGAAGVHFPPRAKSIIYLHMTFTTRSRSWSAATAKSARNRC